MFAAGVAGLCMGVGSTVAFFEWQKAREGPKKVWAYQQRQRSVAAPTRKTKTETETSDVSMALYEEFARFGLPSSDTVYVKDGYVSSFDAQRRIPRWVMELITPESVTSKEGKRDGTKFMSNTDVPEPFRATNADYAAAGLSRGHLAPAQFHKDSQAAMNATFDLSLNAVPQDMAVNATDWLRVEQLCKKLIKESPFKKLYVVTGPVFMPKDLPPEKKRGGINGAGANTTTNLKRVVQYEVVGKHDVAVPTHLFKAILGEKKDGSTEFASFVVPNQAIPDERPLTAYLVPKETLERWTGLELFAKVRNTDNLPSICAAFKCEASAGGLGVPYRSIAKLRAAGTPKALEREWQGVCQSRGGCEKVEEMVAKEYAAQRQAFGIAA